jgi:hypothetical protein
MDSARIFKKWRKNCRRLKKHYSGNKAAKSLKVNILLVLFLQVIEKIKWFAGLQLTLKI